MIFIHLINFFKFKYFMSSLAKLLIPQVLIQPDGFLLSILLLNFFTCSLKFFYFSTQLQYAQLN